MSSVQTRRWNRQEYERMAEVGVLAPDEKVELIDGEIFKKVTQGRNHSVGVILVGDVLRSAMGAGYHIRTQMPLVLDPYSEPEPDIAVVSGSPRDYQDHPQSAVLVVEIADTSLDYDRARKASLYARARLADYWILNVLENCLEIYREPALDATALYGWSYRSVQRLDTTAAVSPLAAPPVRVSVCDLLP